MPLVKRSIKPQHLCRAALPDGVGSELECVTNNTLSTIIRQLSSLSRQAEDVFGELFNEANTFYVRANSLQDRIDRLAVKVTQLDSSVEEVSLQDINMRKAFRSSTVEDQQVMSRTSLPQPVAEMYNSTEKPPPLSVLSNYRDDHIDGIKFYTDPSYFFDLWKEKMLQDTEDKRKEKRRHREQKHCEDSTLQREVKNVRKARNRRQQWNTMALDKELRPDHRNPHAIQQRALPEDVLFPEPRPSFPDIPSHALSSSTEHPLVEHEYQSIGGPVGIPDEPTISYSLNPPPSPSQMPTEGEVNGDNTLPPLPPTDYGMMEYYASSGLPPAPLSPTPMIPSSQTAFALPLPTPALPQSHYGLTSSALTPPLPPVPSPGVLLTPPPPGPPPPLISPIQAHLIGTGEARSQDSQLVTEGRSDLLSAIRMGIQLKKVQEQQEQRAKRERSGNDVASILSRRIAVEYSTSEDESELDENEWSD